MFKSMNSAAIIKKFCLLFKDAKEPHVSNICSIFVTLEESKLEMLILVKW